MTGYTPPGAKNDLSNVCMAMRQKKARFLSHIVRRSQVFKF